MQWTEGREIYQKAGFEFVNLDFNMAAQQLAGENATNALPLVWQVKLSPHSLSMVFT